MSKPKDWLYFTNALDPLKKWESQSPYIEMEDGIHFWPMCSKDGCKNRICLRLKSIFCWPHSMHEFRRQKKQETNHA